jgi:hypothetical protein
MTQQDILRTLKNWTSENYAMKSSKESEGVTRTIEPSPLLSVQRFNVRFPRHKMAPTNISWAFANFVVVQIRFKMGLTPKLLHLHGLNISFINKMEKSLLLKADDSPPFY